ncbi:MAG: ThuA domain-containing protein [Saprospiraceae bacterium]|nr:ThuA domain-containing protein [Saprospiraceae bacterium]MCF8248555.1 ThuA domain-containing protein [Saprospiraceae bacterium]MCF8280278.1 ThuA domain-containing protein [Bacteroidales bacterium]MCF8310289.1 ThuA domain-containing protein [Saprospiraceae bacterium]MCF8439272.1 ThuA domain-containing protein [Saprospiraceae bacterium]
MSVKSFPFFFFVCSAIFVLTGCGPEPKVLVFSKTSGYRHASIETGVAAIQQLGKAEGFIVEATEDSTVFTEENLKKYAAVVFLNNSGDVLNNWQQADFQRFIEAGGGFVGIHGAAATEYDWKWYGKLLGAFFDEHPDIQKATVKVADKAHPATEDLPAEWLRTDEWYNFKPVPPSDKVYITGAKGNYTHSSTDSSDAAINVPTDVRWTYDSKKPFLSENVKVLLTLDEGTYTGGKHGASHPIAWAQEYEGGRSFYTALGHTEESFSEENYLKHLLGGILWAIGKGKLDYSKVKTQRIPQPERFVRTVLAENLDEPIELAVFPDNSGKVLFVERKGAIKIYYPDLDTVETIAYMPVYKEFEEGVMGVAFDPNYLKNKWIYIYYSLMEGGRRNRLSRFDFENDIIHHSTEKVLLEVPEQVGCCHTGGSIDFDSKGNLFLSTGDNTNPFESDGFSPADGRPGRELYDARRSSSNTNDLRGKILRITPQPDGTYTIPKGNLFVEGTPNARPEIYVMGCRNPYRIAVDKKTDCLYWGDVGPDAGKNGVDRGSKGYDFWGRACEAGYYGWPLFRGNHTYFDYNFATKKSGPLHNPEKPINNSPYNTGLTELPPVTSPLIWYSYDESLEFPWLGTGGKNPMAGPIFHAADIPQSPITSNQSPVTTFPEYFENKFFIYEWMRNWIFVVTMDENGKFVQADPFLPNETWNRPMDMAFGPDGALYVLEYGTQWFAQNPDARLNKIEYAPGNRKPIAKIEASQTVAAAPLTVRLSGSSSKDYDGDQLTYDWTVSSSQQHFTEAGFDFVFKTPGEYVVKLKVTDPSGASSRSSVKIIVGNSKPVVAWKLGGNQTFYWDDEDLAYELSVSDAEDGSLSNGKLDPRRVKISIDYLSEGQDVAAIIMGHQTKESATMGSLQFATGMKLIEANDCKTCHTVDSKVNGPSYVDIANRYYGSEFAVQRLSKKVIAGGAGNWGETAMSAHPNLSQKESEDIVKYILSLAGEVQESGSLPFNGTYRTSAHIGKGEKGAYVFQASYRDLGGPNGSNSLSDKQTLVLRYPKLAAKDYSRAAKGVRRERIGQTDTIAVTDLMDGRWIAFDKIDLTGVTSLELGFIKSAEISPGTAVEIRAGSESGKLLGKSIVSGASIKIPIEAAKGIKNLVLVFRNEKMNGVGLGKLDWVAFQK